MAVMNAHQMLLKAAELDAQDKTDDALLAEWNTPFLTGVNQAYIDLYRTLNVRVWEGVALDSGKAFEFADLTTRPDEIFDITPAIPFSASASYADTIRYDHYIDGETIRVPHANEGQTVYVQYRPLPEPLVNPYPAAGDGHTAGEDATEPLYIPEQHQDCMIYKGLAEVYSAQGDADAMAKWEMKYFQAKSNIRKPTPQRRIKNVMEY